MSNDIVSLAVTIGARLRRERNARGWTLDQLSDAAGISRRQLVYVERGETNPSIGTLLALSDALGMALTALVEPPSARLVTIHRAGEGAELWTGPLGGRAVLLVGTQPPDVVNLWDWRINSGERHESAAHRRGCREVLHVISGAIALHIAEDRYQLGEDDSIAFPGDVPHAYANESTEPAHFALTVYEPQLGSPKERKGADA